jgi:hypothetical protein
MGKTARVALHRQPNSYATVEHGATVGADVGVNLRLNGVLVRAQDILNIYANPGNPGGTPTYPTTYWRLIQEIPQNVTALANTTTTGLYVVTGTGTSVTREIEPTIGRTTVANGDGLAGNPVVDLAVVPDAGGGSLLKFVRDMWGRVTGTSVPTTDDLSEGADNLYFTEDRAEAAAMGPANAALSGAMVYTDVVAATKLDLHSPADDSLVARGDGAYANWLSGGFGFGGSTINWSGAAFGRVVTNYAPLVTPGVAAAAMYESASGTDTTGNAVGGFIASSSYNAANYRRLAEIRAVLAGGTTPGQHGGGLVLMTRERDTTGAPTLRLVITDEGNFNLGTISNANAWGNFYGGGKGVVRITNATTIPATNPNSGAAGGVFLYGDSNSLKVRTPSGNIVMIAPNTPPTVTGSRGGNAALASLLTTLAGLGLITDGTTP